MQRTHTTSLAARFHNACGVLFAALATVLAVLATAGITSIAHAQTGKWALDRTHSGMNFSVSHMVVSETTGRFDDFNITLMADKEDFSDAKIDVDIKVESVNTNDKKRDGHLKSPDFFDVAKFPAMTFKAKELKAAGDKKFKMLGDFTMKGVTKPVELDVRYGGVMKDKQGKLHAGFKVTGIINRQDFGVKWNSLLDNGGSVVGDEVELRANIEMIKQ
jgi:polyisoprenoid-binding protein YceI